jgi:hypothetical protein
MTDNVIPFERYHRTKRNRLPFGTGKNREANQQVLAFLGVCEAGFLTRTEIAELASKLPRPALIILHGLLRDQ